MNAGQQLEQIECIETAYLAVLQVIEIAKDTQARPHADADIPLCALNAIEDLARNAESALRAAGAR